MNKNDTVIIHNNPQLPDGFITTVVAVPGDPEYDKHEFFDASNGILVKPPQEKPYTNASTGKGKWYWVAKHFVTIYEEIPTDD